MKPQIIALKQAIKIVGSISALARKTKCSRQAVQNWVSRGQVPPEQCLLIQAATDGKVTCEALRPDVFGAPSQLMRVDDASKKRQRLAGAAVTLAVKSGALPRLRGAKIKCVDCNGVAEAYEHRNYSRPLDVEPVCSGCNSKRGHALDVTFVDAAGSTVMLRNYLKHLSAYGAYRGPYIRRELRLPMQLGRMLSAAADKRRCSINQLVIILLARAIESNPSLVAQ